jgi:hypothetical protein
MLVNLKNEHKNINIFVSITLAHPLVLILLTKVNRKRLLTLDVLDLCSVPNLLLSLCVLKKKHSKCHKIWASGMPRHAGHGMPYVMPTGTAATHPRVTSRAEFAETHF